MALRDLELIDASVPASATVGEAVAKLSGARVAAIAVLGDDRRVLGIVSERDVLGAVFPSYLAEITHSAFLPDDTSSLDELAAQARARPVRDIARASETLDAGDSLIHAAERLMHSEDDALPVVDERRFVGMLSVAGLCQARLDPHST